MGGHLEERIAALVLEMMNELNSASSTLPCCDCACEDRDLKNAEAAMMSLEHKIKESARRVWDLQVSLLNE